MNENLNKTLKSVETEDWLDLHVVRPFCYYWAVLFAKLDIHPNTVTILSMSYLNSRSFFVFLCDSTCKGTNKREQYKIKKQFLILLPSESTFLQSKKVLQTE